jgi:hypothetical protein
MADLENWTEGNRGAVPIQSRAQLEKAKREARSELQRIFDQELKERELERLSRPAAASHC